MGRYLRAQWEASFAEHLSNDERDEIYLNSFLWHLCSWEKVECYEKLDAIKMFEEQAKTKCTIFYEHTDEAYLIENGKHLSIEDHSSTPHKAGQHGNLFSGYPIPCTSLIYCHLHRNRFLRIV